MSNDRQSLQPTGSLDPEIRQFADALEAGYLSFETGETMSLESRRVIAEKVRQRWVQGGPEMESITEHLIAHDHGSVRIRIYQPHEARNGPALVYLHGGGWTIFSLDTHDRLMREYASRANMPVIGIDYSLAPEAKFPTQILECESVINWIEQNGESLGIDPTKLAIGGDSAGANMAVATCLRLRDSNSSVVPAAMLLNYGAFDANLLDAPDISDDPNFTLTQSEMKAFWNNYLRSPEDQANPLANPAIANLRGLPPALMVIPEHDILVTENHRFATRLEKAGIPVEAVVYPGTTHSFLEAVSIAQVSDDALTHSAQWLVDRL
jgi:acetyl esterase